jgi:hypothetical protein
MASDLNLGLITIGEEIKIPVKVPTSTNPKINLLLFNKIFNDTISESSICAINCGEINQIRNILQFYVF